MVLATNRRKRRRSRRNNPFTSRTARAASRKRWGRNRRRYSNRRRSSRRRSRNPVAVGARRLTSGFKPAVLTDAALIAAGAFGNSWVRGQIGNFVPQIKAGIPSYLAGLATSSLLLFVPRVGQKLFLGGVFGEVFRAAKENIPQLARLGDFLDTGTQIGDFLEAGQLSEYEEGEEGLSDYYEANQAMAAGDLASQAAATFE